MLKQLFLIIIFVSLTFCVLAEEDQIIFITNSSDYYFQLGNQATIPIYVTNSIGEGINGQLTYTISEKIITQGFQSSSTNTQSQPFSIEKDLDLAPMGFNFGTSDKETTRTVSMSFSYNHKGVSQKIILPTITLHFVKDQNQQQSQQQQQQQSQQQAQQQQSQPQEEHQPQTSNDEMQKNIQNSQQSQDTNALKNQVDRENSEQQQMSDKINKEIKQDSEYNSAKKELEEMGFKQDSEPQVTSDEMVQEFTNPKTGEKANITADIEDLKESLKNNQTPNQDLNVKSDFKNKNLENQIMQNQNNLNQDLKEKIQDLEKQGFNQTPMAFRNQNNQTTFTKTMMNPLNNETVTFNGELNETNVLDFKEEKDYTKRNIFFLVLILLMVIGYFTYKKYLKYKQQEKPSIVTRILKPIDHRKEALKMIKKAKKLFEKNRKDSYELLSYAIRYYHSHKLDLKKEITNKELLIKLKGKKIFSEVKEILETSSLVEFAKATSKKELFNKAISKAESIIRKPQDKNN